MTNRQNVKHWQNHSVFFNKGATMNEYDNYDNYDNYDDTADFFAQFRDEDTDFFSLRGEVC